MEDWIADAAASAAGSHISELKSSRRGIRWSCKLHRERTLPVCILETAAGQQARGLGELI